MSSHEMGRLFKELLMIGFILNVMMSGFGDFSCSILMVSIVMKSSSFWSLSLTLISTLSLFPVSVAIFNYLSASVLKILY